MDQQMIGSLIRKLRLEKNLTQTALAQILHISNKTVSKWECGSGCPDVSLFPALSETLGADFSALFTGEIEEKAADSGNLRRLRFYICPDCGNLITTTSSASIACCGKVLAAQKLQRAREGVHVELEDHEYYISSDHEMIRDHYITFIALRSSEQLTLRKLYPEWNVQIRLPYIPGATLIWHCKQHGLFYQPLPQYCRTTRQRD